jgi:hypothetical protein
MTVVSRGKGRLRLTRRCQKWITEDYEVASEDIETILKQATEGETNLAFYFNTFLKNKLARA